jgi:hypothetical protein
VRFDQFQMRRWKEKRREKLKHAFKSPTLIVESFFNLFLSFSIMWGRSCLESKFFRNPVSTSNTVSRGIQRDFQQLMKTSMFWSDNIFKLFSSGLKIEEKWIDQFVDISFLFTTMPLTFERK